MRHWAAYPRTAQASMVITGAKVRCTCPLCRQRMPNQQTNRRCRDDAGRVPDADPYQPLVDYAGRVLRAMEAWTDGLALHLSE